ncbi:hypothetical protein BGZ74_004125 [Mortierella antarctica]|nr:hypothetical protein BGZ74_004125 [Mortierella antarctica]
MSSPNVLPPPVTVAPTPATTPALPTMPAPPPTTTPATIPPASQPTTPSPNPLPTDEPQPGPTSDDPSTKTSTSRRPVNSPKPGQSGGGGGGTTSPPATGGSGNNNNSNGTGTDRTGITDSNTKPDSKSVVGPVVGGIAAVLVLAFLIGVFVMRWRKKSRARKRLDVLLDQSGQGHDQITSALGGSPNVGGAGKPRPSSIRSSVARPSSVGQMEMAAVGAGAGVEAQQQQQQQQQQYQQQYQHDGYDNYDYQQGYQQVPYGGYQDQYDQYDPYYSQQQPIAQGHQPTRYYSETSPHLQHQVQGQGQQVPGQHGYTGSPSMTHSSVSPSSYPQPPASNTAGSPRTPLQSATAHAAGGPGSAYDRFNKIEMSDYANTQSPARNPQVIPEGGR